MSARCRSPVRLTPSPRHAAALGALSHPVRLRVFFHLVRAGGERPAGAVAAACGVRAPTLSHHLDRLARVGLVRRRRAGRNVFYAVEPTTVMTLVRLLTACC